MTKNIKEIKSVCEILNDIPDYTMLILDLDNTFMTPHFDLGGDAWFTSLISEVVNKHEDRNLAMIWAITLYSSVQHFIRTKAVEQELVKFVKSWQAKGSPVLALTSRNTSTIAATLNQIRDIGIDFSKNWNIPNDSDTFVGGIIFSGGGDKGAHLSTFLMKHQLPCAHVTMFDDKKRHLEEIAAALELLGIKFSGYRYGYLDDHVTRFNGESANAQLAFLTPHLPPPAREAVRNLKLTMSGKNPTFDTSTFAHGFFIPISNVAQDGAPSAFTMGNES